MYDIKCHILADEFLHDHPHLLNSENLTKLAQHIQTSIDEWIESANNEHWKQNRTHYND